MTPPRPTRRRFLRQSALALGAALCRGRAQGGEPRRDRFGGLREVRFEATGFFRLEQRGRWWMVTPEGHAWLGYGMNHVHPGWLNQDYNRDAWLRRFGAAQFNDEAWKAGLRARVRADLDRCGFNHFGVHNDLTAVAGLGAPEIRALAFVKIAHSFVATKSDFPDVFAPEFELHCETLAGRQVAPHRDNPLVVGWAFTDCPIFTDAEAAARPRVTQGSPRDATPTWPRVLRNLPATAPGKQAWLRLMLTRYGGDIRTFNDGYGEAFGSWDTLLAAENWRGLTDMANARELADNQAFLAQVVDRYYAVACAAIRRHAPRHLIFGDKLNANTDGGDAVLAATARHVDVVFYQMYERWAEQRAVLDRWRRVTAKPFFNGDGTFSTPNPMMPHPHGPHGRDQAERGALAYEFGRNAFARTDFVGWSVCGWVDTWKTMPRKDQRQHSGFFSPQGEPHEAYIRRLREVSDGLYGFARGDR